MTVGEPGIRITTTTAGIEISQQRPPVATLLRGLSVADALEQIPTLLPICGKAQSMAALRAVEAARGHIEDSAEHAQRESRLWQEQAIATAWRLAIDWPKLLDQPQDLDGLRAVQRADTSAGRASALEQYIPEFDAVHDTDDLLDWTAGAPCQAAGVIRRAAVLDKQESPVVSGAPVAGERLSDLARDALGAEPFDALEPGIGAIEVGPLAMCRDPLISALKDRPDIGVLRRRLLAQLLDTRLIADRLSANTGDDREAPCTWPLQTRVGLGRAMTARGPVFHRVSLAADDETVRDWRVIAPTDWHFSTRGPVACAAAGTRHSADWLRFLVAGFDPCAPWEVVTGPVEGSGDA